MKNIISVLCIISALSFCSQNCEEKEKFPEYVDFTFVIPLSISPVQQDFKIGDTLWLSADFPDTVFEFHSGKYYKTENYSFPTRIGFYKLISNEKYLSEQPGASTAFNIVNKIGSANNFSSTFGDFKLHYESGRYKCKIGIVPKATGVFCIFFLSPGSVKLPDIDLGITQDGRTRLPSYKFFFYIINDGITNFDLYSKYCKAVSLSVPIISNIYGEQKGTFTFEVK